MAQSNEEERRIERRAATQREDEKRRASCQAAIVEAAKQRGMKVSGSTIPSQLSIDGVGVWVQLEGYHWQVDKHVAVEVLGCYGGGSRPTTKAVVYKQDSNGRINIDKILDRIDVVAKAKEAAKAESERQWNAEEKRRELLARNRAAMSEVPSEGIGGEATAGGINIYHLTIEEYRAAVAAIQAVRGVAQAQPESQ